MSLGMKEDRMFRLQENLNTNTKAVADVVQANQEAAISLTMMQIILVGSLAFQILDRLTGEWTVVNREWAKGFIEPMLAQPYAWFIVNLIAWLVLGFFVLRIVSSKGANKSQVVDIQIRLNEELNIDLLDMYLETKTIVQEDVVYTPTGQTTKTCFLEGKLSRPSWGGTQPKVTLEYDDEHGYMLSVYVHYSKAEGKLKPKEIRERILSELTEQRVLKHDRTADEDEEDEE
jgi:WD repeat-containing protein 35